MSGRMLHTQRCPLATSASAGYPTNPRCSASCSIASRNIPASTCSPPSGRCRNSSDKKAEVPGNIDAIVARYPSGILIYNAAGSRPIEMSRWLLVDFLIEITEVVIAVFLLSQTRLKTFVARVTFVLLLGVVVGIATNLSNWNWFGFSWNYTLACVFIQVVGFLCAGLVAALCLRKQTFGVTSPGWLMQKLFGATLGD